MSSEEKEEGLFDRFSKGCGELRDQVAQSLSNLFNQTTSDRQPIANPKESDRRVPDYGATDDYSRRPGPGQK